MIEAGVYELGAENADLLLKTFRGGLIGAVGHDLTLRVGEWSGEAVIGDLPEESTLVVEIDLRTIEVIGATGGIKPLSDGDREDIAASAAKTLAVTKHPIAVFRSSEVNGDWAGGVVSGELELHGVTRPLDLTIESVDGTLRATTAIVQTDFGIKPYSALFGTLTVRDDVSVEVAIAFE